jgi:PAS domain S-box-containing protein
LQDLSKLSTLDPALLEELFDHTHDITFFMKDAAGRYLVVNQALVERHGYRQKSEVIGRQACEICPGDLGLNLTQQDRQVLEDGKPIIELLELHWRTPHRPVWCLTTKLPIRNEAGEILGLIGISQDVRTPIATDEIPAGVATALRLLEQQYASSISASSLAAAAELSPARFARIIKRIYQLTPNQLISKVRLMAGAKLLRESTLSVSEIANACGFNDHSAFTRAFGAASGMSPSAFRHEQLSPRPENQLPR